MLGIINVQWFDNPGAVLLCYALQQSLKKNVKRDSLVIDYAAGGGSGKENILKKLVTRIDSAWCKLFYKNDMRFGKALKIRHQRYETFRDTYLYRTDRFVDVNNKILTKFDQFIVGSDVVWRPEIAQSKDADVYFLMSPVVKNAKKISYAASIGTNDIMKIKGAYSVYKELSGFDFLSVREQESAEFLEKLCGKRVYCHIDPVFLLDKQDWKKLLKRACQTQEKYVYLYILSPNPNAINAAVKLAKKYDLTIVYDLHTKENFEFKKIFKKAKVIARAAMTDGPCEFLERIISAEYIITNSFHGTAFSLIFEKKFFSYPCYNSGSNTSLRIINILSEFELSRRFECQTIEDMAEEEIDFCKVNNRIAQLQDYAFQYLKEAID